MGRERAHFGAWLARMLVGVLAIGVLPARAQLNPTDTPDEIVGVGVTEHQGEAIDLSLTFETAEGETARLSRWFDGEKPVVMALVYYECPVVCPTVLNKMQACFNELDMTIGEDFNVVVVSFDPTEGVPLAASVKGAQLAGYTHRITDEVREGWAFLTGSAANSRQLARGLGFNYKSVNGGEFSHPVSIFVLTPNGRVARYIYGYDYPPRDIEYSLIDASEGGISPSFGQRLVHFCYRYDPTAGTYSLEAFRVMQVAGGIMVLFLGSLIGGLLLWERGQRRQRALAAARSGDGRSALAGDRLAGVMR